MDIKVNKEEGLSIELTVAFSPEELDQKYQEKIAEIAKKAKIDGFRPGKAPLQVIEKRYGDSAYGEIVDTLMKESSVELFKKNKYRPAVQPKFDVTKFEKGKKKAFEYQVSFESLPKIKEVKYQDYTFEKPVAEVKDGDVKEAVARVAEGIENLEPLAKKRAIKAADFVEFDFEGSVDGVKHDSMKAENYKLEIGSNSFIPGFEEAMIGLKIGDKKTITVNFPVEYHAKEFAGKEAKFDVIIHEILANQSSKVDDEMAKKAGFKDLLDMKQVAKAKLEEDFKELSNQALKKTLLDRLDKDVKTDLPPTLVKNEFDMIWQQYEADLNQDAKKKPTKAETDKHKKNCQEIAERRVKLGIVLAEIGQKNKVEVSEDEVREAVMGEFKKYPGQEQQLMQMIQGNQQFVENIKAKLYESKVVDYILSKIKVTEKKTSKADLIKMVDES